MALVKQIPDKGAVLQWSPIRAHSNLVALGTKDSSSIGFDDYGGELELHHLNFSDTSTTSTTLLGKARASSRFASLTWSQMALNSTQYSHGLIAGGMTDGFINIWDVAKLSYNDHQSLITSLQQHKSAVCGLQFNPHKESSHLLASGGGDGEVFVMSLERPEAPNVFVPAPPPTNSKHTADITKVAWNTQVAHILATAAQNGVSFIWDLRQKKAWCELREPAGGTVSDISWNPDQGLHLVTASGDDKNPVIKLWDLRSSTSLPLATLQGHTEGVLSVSWCPTDASFLLSCGKDNKTFLWDLFHLQPVFQLPSAQDDGAAAHGTNEQSVFGSLASSATQRRYDVSWSPCLPGVVSACSFDRRVQFYSLTGVKSKLGRAPKWLRRPVGATFGFGGKLVAFSHRSDSSAVGADGRKIGSFKVTVSQITEDPELVEDCTNFQNLIASGGYTTFCENKATSAESYNDRQVWHLMKVICFEPNAREALLSHFGFKSPEIAAAAEKYLAANSKNVATSSPADLACASAATLSPSSFNTGDAASIFSATASTVSAETVFGSDPIPPLESLTISPPPAAPVLPISPAADAMSTEDSRKALLSQISPDALADMASVAVSAKEAEPMIRQAIVVGNFTAAVDCCLQAGLLAEALVLAQCGDQSLWLRSQEVFFERQRSKHPYLHILYSIIKSELMTYVLQSNLSAWQETLAVLSTYGKSEEFPSMCETLGSRLEAERGDVYSATLCYMCAANVERVVSHWLRELKAANESLGRLDTKALQRFVEKVVVFTQANPGGDVGSDCSNYFAEYAGALASQGKFDIALNYLKDKSLSEKVLIDRLYHASSKVVGSRAPAFPFEKVAVTGNVAASSSSTKSVEAAAAGMATTSAVAVQQLQSHNIQSGQTQRPSDSAASASASSASVPTSTKLPQGWSQAIDPASGRAYYFNQYTNVTQWEPPISTPAPSSFVQTITDVAAPHKLQFASVGVGAVGGYTSGSFVSPVGPAKAPDVSVIEAIAQPPVVLAQPAQVFFSEEVNALGALIESVTASAAPSEKRQVVAINEAFSVLAKKTAAGEVSQDIIIKIAAFTSSISTRNYVGANTIQTDLANTIWSQHKEWIKGLKIFVQLASKK